MDLHAVSHACHHPNGLVYFSKGSEEMSGYIVGISKSSNKELETEISEALVLDVELMDHIFKVPITTVKRIPHGCRLVFSQALKVSLYKVVAQPDYVDAWVRPKNRQERRFGNRKSLQQSSILKSLATRGKNDCIAMLVKSILDGFVLGSFGQAPNNIALSARLTMLTMRCEDYGNDRAMVERLIVFVIGSLMKA
nr:reverse transcriptase domain-containing protein [Tanacetum cinerariifolium]